MNDTLKKNQDKSSYGGYRDGAGRKKGSPNKKTQELQKAVSEGGITPLDYLLWVVRNDDADPKDRMTAANMAAPYVHAKLSSIEVNATISNHEDALDELK